MSRHDFSRLFDQLDSLGVGFGPLFRDLQTATTGYPPHNIILVSDKEIILEMAVAGFKRDEISIEEHEDLLTVKGNRSVQDRTSEGVDYQFRGIGKRSFERRFRIAEYFEVKEATLEDGILTITFVKNVPEEAKPKVIAIK